MSAVADVQELWGTKPMNLAFDCDGRRWPIDADPSRAPRTLAALAACLPLELQLHTPKIAGGHIYWHAPFVEPAEGTMDVMQVPPGAFIYWPVRQFLEITFAPLQAETARITLLGHLGDGLDELAALGAALRQGQGRRRFDGRLSLAEPVPVRPQEKADAGLPAELVAERERLWAACPAEIQAILDSRAIMHPAGPLFMAEGELRVLHETLWRIRERHGADPEAMLRFAAALACGKAAACLHDLCHLTETAQLLRQLEAAFGQADWPFLAMNDEAILMAGRLAAWLDLLIPWSDVNEAIRAAADAVPHGAAT